MRLNLSYRATVLSSRRKIYYEKVRNLYVRYTVLVVFYT